MKRNTHKKGLLKKIAFGAGLLGVLGGFSLVEKETRTYKEFSEIYQGYSVDSAEGITSFAFDKKSLTYRECKNPKYYPIGMFDLTKKLEIGKKYNVKTVKPGFPIGLLSSERIVLITPYNSENSPIPK